jgi:hypothetical protein
MLCAFINQVGECIVFCNWPKEAHGPGRITDHEYLPPLPVAAVVP